MNHLLLRAARGEAVERPPVWAMRQAGRWDPEFNKLRAGKTFYEFSENVDLAAQTSLLPKRFGVDAIILFYDITTLTVAMGLPFKLEPGRGPVPDNAIKSLADVEKLQATPDPARFGHVLELAQRVKSALHGELPVIGFAGAPFTLATYCIGTGKDLTATRKFVSEQPATWNALLDKLTTATIHFLKEMVNAGIEVYQLFDSWAGMLERPEYEKWAQAMHSAILAAVSNVPRIIFVKEAPFLDLVTSCGADVVSLGTRHDLAAARKTYPQLVFQGNVDEAILRTGTPEEVTAATRRSVAESGGQRHIVNLNHGVDKSTPVVNFEAYVQAVKG